MAAGAVGRTAIAGTVLVALSGSTVTAVSLSSASAPVPLPTFVAAPTATPDLPARPVAAPGPAGAGVVDGGTLAAIALTPAIAAATQPVEAPAPAVTPAVPVARRQSAVVERRPGQGRHEQVRRAVAERLSPDTRADIRRACGMGVLDGDLCRLG